MAKPVVGLSEVVKDDAAAIASTGRQDNRGRGVGFAGHPGRVKGVCDEEEGHDQNHPTGNLVDKYKQRISLGFTVLSVGHSDYWDFKKSSGKISGQFHLTKM